MTRLLAWAAVLSCCLASSVRAQAPEGGAGPKLGELLAGVRWVGPPVTAATLEGKSVAVMVYATWCPKCNTWSGELMRKIVEAAADQPVVVLAVNVDERPGGAAEYVTERGFFGPNVLHGYDPTLVRRGGFEHDLFLGRVFSPAGEQIYDGTAQAFPQVLGGAGAKGSFRILDPAGSPAVKSLLWPLELAQATDAMVLAAIKKLPQNEAEEARATIDRFLDAKLATIQAGYKGTPAEKLEAYATAVALSKVFRSTPQSAKAKQAAAFMQRVPAFQRELDARKAYEGVAGNPMLSPARRTSLLKGVAERFAGTHFGDLAAAEAGP